MGKVASEYSEICIVTSDNPRHEEPRTIIEDIVKGIQNHVKTLSYVDRKIAIETALSLAQAGDVILIAGKGNENYQIIGDKVIPFDDREVVLKYLIE
jgi:UDP-N-acetylmuramoyl-L-alanyl-D-glutamate--2,6-diaminopimelate ligase